MSNKKLFTQSSKCRVIGLTGNLNAKPVVMNMDHVLEDTDGDGASRKKKERAIFVVSCVCVWLYEYNMNLCNHEKRLTTLH
jgi:hypothetical protein